VQAVVAEKPSVARDIARVLGADTRGDGCLRGRGYVVTWAIGHLVRLAEPQEIDPAWKRWAKDTLPMLPATWPLVVIEDAKAQFEAVKRILRDPDVTSVVCATDAGREGELIFRYLYEASGCRKPVQRLWISSLTSSAIQQGFARLRPGSAFDPLADAARGRSQADWLVGMNLSRASTIAWSDTVAGGEVLSVGRVQTPTLALLVERELAIRSFVPEDYLEVVATFAGREDTSARYEGTWFAGDEPKPAARRLPPDGVLAAGIVERARRGSAAVERVDKEQGRAAPPLLYDLTELQRHANRLYGLTAQRTLQLAQALYERHKLISYPRTDSRHLTKDVAATLPGIVAAIQAPYASLLKPGTGQQPLSRRYVDDTEVGDHHAIIPTGAAADEGALGADERRLYDLVCRRLLQAWQDDHLFSVTNVVTAIRDGATLDRYHSTGTTVDQVGWKALDPPAPRPREDEAVELPPGLAARQPQDVAEVAAVAKKTRPPRRFTEATLLTAMETAGQSLDDKELSQAMKDRGLGTPATRAETIETLLRRQYAERQGKALAATERGVRLIGLVHPHVKSPQMTGEWEAELARLARGEAALAPFMERIAAWVREVVGETLAAAPERAPAALPAAVVREVPRPEVRPTTSPDRLGELLGSAFKLPSFRRYQEAVCRAVTEGRDTLLVMPTGAGKSLCYQLPGLARGGTTLVISPLIALIEDQVGKLQALGLRAERIHSGRERTASRQVCLDYLDGKLDYLFIAPERLGVPGFPQMLAKRTPALVAVDEAHCISHWGHDFRPDYRLLKDRLAALRPAPVIALTATATPLVQEDIAAQLGLGRLARFIHGFRRTNIAVEIAEVLPADRPDTVKRLLDDDARRPAIVYAPTRKQADALAVGLKPLRAAAYHAGMATPQRDKVQSAFLAGRLDVIVATIAFGMGVDKADVRTVIHTGLPGSVEGYYQEIGRGGRDGKPCRAVLLFSFADRKTHEFFHERDYPEPSVLRDLWTALAEPRPLLELRRRSRLDDELFDKALEKLRTAGGAVLGPGDLVSRGKPGWAESYTRQREHKQAQLDSMFRFAESHGCRMLGLVRHFGDQEDRGEPCGTCDVCAPADCAVRPFREPTRNELALLEAVLARLRQRDGIGLGRLCQEAGPDVDRKEFERVVGGLSRAGFVRLQADEFEKDGRNIKYQRVLLTREGREAKDLSAHVLLTADAPRGRGRGRKKAKAATTRKVSVPAAGGAPPDPALVDALKAWRLAEAREHGIPAYRILTDRALGAVASSRPRSLHALGDVNGIGPAICEKYGRQILALVTRV
jgi:DNA topoisomerase-3